MSRFQTLPTVVIVDDDPVERAELAELVADHPELALVGVGTSDVQGAALCAHHRPDVAVIDLVVPDGGRVVIDAIRSASPRTAIVAYAPRSAHHADRTRPDPGAVSVYVDGDADQLADTLVRVGADDTNTAPRAR